MLLSSCASCFHWTHDSNPDLRSLSVADYDHTFGSHLIKYDTSGATEVTLPEDNQSLIRRFPSQLIPTMFILKNDESLWIIHWHYQLGAPTLTVGLESYPLFLVRD
jgi:hypothetical protein